MQWRREMLYRSNSSNINTFYSYCYPRFKILLSVVLPKITCARQENAHAALQRKKNLHETKINIMQKNNTALQDVYNETSDQHILLRKEHALLNVNYAGKCAELKRAEMENEREIKEVEALKDNLQRASQEVDQFAV